MLSFVRGVLMPQPKGRSADFLSVDIIVIAYFLLLLVLTLSQHRLGRRHVWSAGVTSFSFFGTQSASSSTTEFEDPTKEALMRQQRVLPSPVTAKVAPRPSPGVTRPAARAEEVSGGGSPQMKPGGHYIMYIPPPSQPKRKGSGR